MQEEQGEQQAGQCSLDVVTVKSTDVVSPGQTGHCPGDVRTYITLASAKRDGNNGIKMKSPKLIRPAHEYLGDGLEDASYKGWRKNFGFAEI